MTVKLRCTRLVYMRGTFRQWLRRLRKAAGHTQASLGAAIGVDPRTIYGWEKLGLFPDVENELALARVLGVEVIFGFSAEKTARLQPSA